MFRAYDVDGSGEIAYDEFEAMVKQGELNASQALDGRGAEFWDAQWAVELKA